MTEINLIEESDGAVTMRFMNRWEISDARARWARHPVLGPATATLANLRDAADANSDGWAYWPKPVRAAEKLMDLIEGGDRGDTERADATVEKLRAALRPIKAFRTRSGLNFEIVEELTEARFHRTIYRFLVLSEEPIPDETPLEVILRACIDGPYVGYDFGGRSEALTGKQMADALYAAGSEPGFFRLDDDGNPTEEE